MRGQSYRNRAQCRERKYYNLINNLIIPLFLDLQNKQKKYESIGYQSRRAWRSSNRKYDLSISGDALRDNALCDDNETSLQ